jgi:hypothetical protein
MSDYSGSPSDHQLDFQPPKRKATQAGLDGHPAGRSVKRRASKACQCCRARKVRCNVTEHGAPCTNCRLDEVDCIVSESRRKKLVSLLVHHPTLFYAPTRTPFKQRIEALFPFKCRHAMLLWSRSFWTSQSRRFVRSTPTHLTNPAAPILLVIRLG